MSNPHVRTPVYFLHRADGEPLAQDLYRELTAQGHYVWWDRKAMDSRGRTFLQEIKDAIARVDRLLLIVTPGAVDSQYVRDEWEYALSLCKVVTPLLRSGDYSLVPEPLKNLHTLDFRENRSRSDANEELAHVLSAGIGQLGQLYGVPELLPHFLPREAPLRRLRERLLAGVNTPLPSLLAARAKRAFRG